MALGSIYESPFAEKENKEYFYRVARSTEITTSTDPEDIWMKGGLYAFPIYTKDHRNPAVSTDKLVDAVR